MHGHSPALSHVETHKAFATGIQQALSITKAHSSHEMLFSLKYLLCFSQKALRIPLRKEAEGIQPDGNTRQQKDYLSTASIWQKTYCSPDMVSQISAPSDRSFRKRRAPETGLLRFPVHFFHHDSYHISRCDRSNH